MTHGSLFSGVGGFDLAAQWVGWENVFHCDNNEFCQRLLAKRFPASVGYSDIKQTDFTKHNGSIDIISGGFPCQPYSHAGERKGKEDDRHLWPEMLRAIREIDPTWVVGENVRGLINWSGGLVFDEIQSDLENEGYEVLPILLTSYAKGKDHQRYRIYFIAYSERARLQRPNTERENVCVDQGRALAVDCNEDVYRWSNGFSRYSQYIRKGNGLSRKLDKDRIRALGNAIDPHLAFELFKIIHKIEYEKAQSRP